MAKSESIQSVHEQIDKDFPEHLERCREFLRQKGEEEIGSPHFESFIRQYQDALKGIGVVDFDFSSIACGFWRTRTRRRAAQSRRIHDRGGTSGF